MEEQISVLRSQTERLFATQYAGEDMSVSVSQRVHHHPRNDLEIHPITRIPSPSRDETKGSCEGELASRIQLWYITLEIPVWDQYRP